MQKPVPFYANTPDDTHCYQAALRSVLKYFLPEKDYSWEELEKMTAKKEGLWTWPTQGLISLHKLGFEVILIEAFDGEKFVEEGGEYLQKEYGKEVADEQIKHSDITQERALYKEFLSYSAYEKRVPSTDEIKRYLDNGYLIICNVNASALNDKKGYIGHFVVIIDYDNDYLYFHDPGLPPQENRSVPYKLFMKAWEYPNEKAKNLIALKYNITILMSSDVTWEEYRDLRLEALKEEPQAFATPYESQKDAPPQDWQKWLDSCRKGDRDWLVFVSDGNQLIGMAGAYQTEDDKKNGIANMIAMYIKKQERGAGVGKRLATELLDLLKKTKIIQKVKLAVNVDQEVALALYKKFGFVVRGSERIKLGDGKEHEVLVMEKEL